MICPPCKAGGKALERGESQEIVKDQHDRCIARDREHPSLTWCDCACKTTLILPGPGRSA